jgi:hypothetical protein
MRSAVRSATLTMVLDCSGETSRHGPGSRLTTGLHGVAAVIVTWTQFAYGTQSVYGSQFVFGNCAHRFHLEITIGVLFICSGSPSALGPKRARQTLTFDENAAGGGAVIAVC